MGPVELLARSAQAAADTSAGTANSPRAIMRGAALVSAGMAYALGWPSRHSSGPTFPSAAKLTRSQDSGWSNGPAPAGDEATGDGLTVITIGLNDGAGTGLKTVTPGVNDAGDGLNDGSGVLDELVQAASGTLARMLSTITNKPGIRTVRV
jgi:hypothetical protein